MAVAHLAESKTFRVVLSQPALAKTQHFVVHFMERQQAFHQGPKNASLAIGVVVPKRWAKRAVTRNCIRRQVYAWFQQWCTDRGNVRGLFVVRLRQSFEPAREGSADSTALRTCIRHQLIALGRQVSARVGRHGQTESTARSTMPADMAHGNAC